MSKWENLNLAAAFVAGTLFGTITTLRLTKAIIAMLNGRSHRARREVHEEGDDPEAEAPVGSRLREREDSG